jgi:hypothetical protein
MSAHLKTQEKRIVGPWGVPYWFYFIMSQSTEVSGIERGWMNQAILVDGTMPPLNKLYGPL